MNQYVYGVSEYPETRIYIKDPDGTLVDINEVTVYVYKIRTYNEINDFLRDIDTNGDVTIDYVSYIVENSDYPLTRYFELVKVNPDYTEETYKIKNNKITYNGYAEKGYIEIYLTLEEPLEKTEDEEEKGLIGNILTTISNFFENFMTFLYDAFTAFTEALLEPDEAMMDTINNKVYRSIIQHIPILEVPYQVLDKLANGYDSSLLEQDKTTLPEWKDLYLPGYENNKPLIEGGTFNLNDYIESHEGFKLIQIAIKTITSGIFALLFVEYLTDKFKQIF